MNSNHDRYPEDSRELAEAVGRLLIVGFEGSEVAEVEGLVTRVRPAGLIFFRRNYPETDGPRRLRELIDSAQALAEGHLGRRLFMAIDHEGGQVQRLPAPYTQLPPAGEAALRGLAPAEVGALAERGARELAATGFNFNLAPVLDVAPPVDSFMGLRSFGDDPEWVLACGRASLEAYHRAGILGAGKHFPGLGAAVIDPHHELPTLTGDLRRLREVDLVPFQGLVAAGLQAVMTTHALYPALDRERPATFSEEIVDLLKNSLGFTGAVLTDDLEMGAVIKNYPLGEAAVEAVRAGHDLALICRRRVYIDECRQALGAALRQGRLAESRLVDAHARSEALARRLAAIQPDRATRDQWLDALSGQGEGGSAAC